MGKEQALVRCRVSAAVQMTVVEPTLKSEPLAGVHETLTGGAPPVAVAVAKLMPIG
jgi:hypothetical protein